MSKKAEELLARIRQKAEKSAGVDLDATLSPEGLTLENLNEKNNETINTLYQRSHDGSEKGM